MDTHNSFFRYDKVAQQHTQLDDFCLAIYLQPYFDLKGTNELMTSNEVAVVRKKLNNDILILLSYFLHHVPL